MRLHVYLAQAGLASRRACEEFIRRGLVTVNGKKVTAMGVMVEPGQDVVEYKRRVISLTQLSRLIAYYKPVGVVSTMQRSREGGQSLSEALPFSERLFPIGRLDKNSEGLLLLTNDGKLALRLSHPRYEHEKEYEATLARQLVPDELRRLRQPFILDGYRTQPAQVTPIGERTYRIILREGRKRQIRRICEKVGVPVLRLIRVRLGPFTIGDLRPGDWRELNYQQAQQLIAGQ